MPQLEKVELCDGWNYIVEQRWMIRASGTVRLRDLRLRTGKLARLDIAPPTRQLGHLNERRE